MNDWINVKDRLPDICQETKTSGVLVVRTNDSDYMTAIYDSTDFGPAVFWRLLDGENVEVTHWISLPGSLSDWNSVKDKLPDVEQESNTSGILVARTENRDYITVIYDARGFGSATFWRLSDGENVEVTHWLALPELPLAAT